MVNRCKINQPKETTPLLINPAIKDTLVVSLVFRSTLQLQMLWCLWHQSICTFKVDLHSQLYTRLSIQKKSKKSKSAINPHNYTMVHIIWFTVVMDAPCPSELHWASIKPTPALMHGRFHLVWIYYRLVPEVIHKFQERGKVLAFICQFWFC